MVRHHIMGWSIGIALAGILLASCSGSSTNHIVTASPTSSPAGVGATPTSSSGSEATPTSTVVTSSPTATSLPGTDTPIPPTATPLPPTPTPVPPTASGDQHSWDMYNGAQPQAGITLDMQGYREIRNEFNHSDGSPPQSKDVTSNNDPGAAYYYPEGKVRMDCGQWLVYQNPNNRAQSSQQDQVFFKIFGDLYQGNANNTSNPQVPLYFPGLLYLDLHGQDPTGNSPNGSVPPIPSDLDVVTGNSLCYAQFYITNATGGQITISKAGFHLTAVPRSFGNPYNLVGICVQNHCSQSGTQTHPCGYEASMALDSFGYNSDALQSVVNFHDSADDPLSATCGNPAVLQNRQSTTIYVEMKRNDHQNFIYNVIPEVQLGDGRIIQFSNLASTIVLATYGNMHCYPQVQNNGDVPANLQPQNIKPDQVVATDNNSIACL